jgi:hypothetical protein
MLIACDTDKSGVNYDISSVKHPGFIYCPVVYLIILGTK